MKSTSVGPIFVAFGSLLLGGMLRAVPAQAADVRIQNVTVVSPERLRPLQNATVIVRNDRIVSVSAQASARPSADETLIDGKGLYLTPGLIDSHVHSSEAPGMRPQDEQAHPDIAKAARAQIPRSYLLFGYTTLIDLISSPREVAQWNANEVRPDLRFCGAVPVIGGYGAFAGWPIEEFFRQRPYALVQKGEESKVPAGVDPAKLGLFLTSGPGLTVLSAKVGPVILSLGYGALFLSLARMGVFSWVLRPIAALGRMALTNYVMQSVVLSFVFFGFGLGLFGKMGAATALALGCGLYVVQAVLSLVWLRHYRFGPLEWLWRVLMYGRVLRNARGGNADPSPM